MLFLSSRYWDLYNAFINVGRSVTALRAQRFSLFRWMKPLFASYARRFVDCIRDPLPKSDYFIEFLKHLKSNLSRLNKFPSSPFFCPKTHSSACAYYGKLNEFKRLVIFNVCFGNFLRIEDIGDDERKRLDIFVYTLLYWIKISYYPFIKHYSTYII